ncbi:MAG: hypothetical protein ACRDAO_04800 [Culicoidibacterales bacterium]
MWSKWEQTQPIASRIIANSLKRNRLSHAILLQGQTVAVQLEFALFIIQAKLCTSESHSRPCGYCATCQRILHNTHPDVLRIEPDGSTIKKEQIQQLQHELTQTSFETEQQFYVLIGAELMTPQAANSLLKFLEEPTGNQTAFLLVENQAKVLPTILSRVQIVQLLPPDQKQRRQVLLQQGIDETLIFYANALSSEYAKIKQLVHDNEFQQLIADLLKYVEQLESEQYGPLIAQIGLEKWFSKRQRALEIIQLLVATYEGVIHHGEWKVTICEQLREQLTRHQAQQRIQQLLQLERNIRGNALLSLALTGYHLELMKGSGKR